MSSTASAEERDANIDHVIDVLEEIGAADVPRLDIFNKIDLPAAAPRIDRDEQGLPTRVWVSARERLGLELIPQAIAELLGRDIVAGSIVLDPAWGRLRARLYAAGAVVAETQREDGSALLSIKMPALDFQRLAHSEHLDAGALLQRN